MLVFMKNEHAACSISKYLFLKWWIMFATAGDSGVFQKPMSHPSFFYDEFCAKPFQFCENCDPCRHIPHPILVWEPLTSGFMKHNTDGAQAQKDDLFAAGDGYFRRLMGFSIKIFRAPSAEAAELLSVKEGSFHCVIRRLFLERPSKTTKYSKSSDV